MNQENQLIQLLDVTRHQRWLANNLLKELFKKIFIIVA
jgi:hypothetical protein